MQQWGGGHAEQDGDHGHLNGVKVVDPHAVYVDRTKKALQTEITAGFLK